MYGTITTKIGGLHHVWAYVTEYRNVSLEDAKTILCPLGSKSHPEYKGMTLDQVAKTEDGRKVLEYLAGESYQPNGDKNGQKAKSSAKVLLASLQPA